MLQEDERDALPDNVRAQIAAACTYGVFTPSLDIEDLSKCTGCHDCVNKAVSLNSAALIEVQQSTHSVRLRVDAAAPAHAIACAMHAMRAGLEKLTALVVEELARSQQHST